MFAEFDQFVVEVIAPNKASSQSTLNRNINTMGMISLVTSAASIGGSKLTALINKTTKTSNSTNIRTKSIEKFITKRERINLNDSKALPTFLRSVNWINRMVLQKHINI